MISPDNNYFEALNGLKPAMEQYNDELINAFDTYLVDPSRENLKDVFKVREKEISSSCANSYGFVNYLHIISDLAMAEFDNGLIPLTEGTGTYKEAIDKFHKIVFMKRRNEFLGDKEAKEAVDYIVKNRISSITLSYIIENEYGTDSAEIIEYWKKIYRENGLQWITKR